MISSMLHPHLTSISTCDAPETPPGHRPLPKAFQTSNLRSKKGGHSSRVYIYIYIYITSIYIYIYIYFFFVFLFSGTNLDLFDDLFCSVKKKMAIFFSTIVFLTNIFVLPFFFFGEHFFFEKKTCFQQKWSFFWPSDR